MAEAINLSPGELGAINNIQGTKIIDAGDLSGDLDSGPYAISKFPTIAVHIIFTGAPTGQFFVQGSNVLNPGASDWVTIPFVDASGSAVNMTASGAPGSYLANASGLGFTNLRVIYDFTSGTGSADVWFGAKGA